MKAVTGNILFVDLSTATSWREQVPDWVYENYLSGLGLGVHILYDRIPAGADPYGPDNILGFLAGVLVGTGGMFSGRFLVVGKSPLTGGWGDSNCGGNLAPAIKRAGYDGIFIKGKAKTPVYIYIKEDQVEILSAYELWGLDAVETEDRLIAQHGKHARVACIGPAGENLVRFAGIINDHGRIAARSGLGAVMGAKQLKALVVEGRQKINVEDQGVLKHWRDEIQQLMPKGQGGIPPWAMSMAGLMMRLIPSNFRIDGLMSLPPFSKWGTASGIEVAIISGDAPIRNWRGRPVDYPSKAVGIGKIGPTQKKKYYCSACPLGCGSIVEMQGRYTETHRPEYETVIALGANLLNRDLESIYDLNEYCNRMGLDSISTGAVLAFAFDCYAHGLLKGDCFPGLSLVWGDPDCIRALLESIVAREGLGAILAEGVKRATEMIGQGSQKYAFHAGGQELPMHDPRIDPAYGVLYYSDPTPGRHTVTSTVEYDMSRLWTRVQSAPEPPRQYSKKEKYLNNDLNARKNAAGAIFKAVLDCAGLCLFGAHLGVDRLGFFETLNAATGLGKSPDEYMRIGKNVQDLRQWFNIKHGLEPAEVGMNTLVSGDPPAKKGPARKLRFDINGMRRLYWAAMGWDEYTGYPLEKPEKP